jgi:hypothetical protein
MVQVVEVEFKLRSGYLSTIDLVTFVAKNAGMKLGPIIVISYQGLSQIGKVNRTTRDALRFDDRNGLFPVLCNLLPTTMARLST